MLEQHYKTLGLPPNTDQDTVKKRYRELAKLYHPDVNTSQEAKAHFIAINEAYEAILNPSIRKTIVRPQQSTTPTSDFEERLKKARAYAKHVKHQERQELEKFSSSRLLKFTKGMALFYLCLAAFVLFDYNNTYTQKQKILYKIGDEGHGNVHLKVAHKEQAVEVSFFDIDFFAREGYTHMEAEISQISGIVHNITLFPKNGESVQHSNSWSVYSAWPIMLLALLLPLSLFFISAKADFYYGLVYFSAGFPIIALIVTIGIYLSWR